MKYTRADLSEVAKQFLGALDREGISCVEQLESMIGRIFEVDDSDDFVEVPDPAEGLTPSYTVSYIRPKKGIPIEVKFNLRNGYTHVILKMDEELEGYDTLFMDPFDNFVQHKVIGTEGVSTMRRELNRIELLK